MIRSEIIQQFRADNPEITARVLTDAVLNSWLTQGNKEFCVEVRCIRDNGTTIITVENDISWVLTTEISNFFDINDYPGSGVVYNNKALVKTTMASLDEESSTWRDWSSGVPKKWYRQGNYLYLDRKIDSAVDDLIVYSVLLPDDWITDIAPFNALTYLSPYHYAMVLYLTKRAKAKVGKAKSSAMAKLEYDNYVKWVKNQLGGNKNAPIIFQPEAGIY